MTEEEARAWLRETLDVSRETIGKIEAFAAAVIAANSHQNLISTATIPQMWARHIVDSAQLVLLDETRDEGPWLDLGSGPGFPGIVIAILQPRPVVLVESRRKRFEFLAQMAETLGLDNVSIHGGRLETLPSRPVSTITARAFAPLPKLLDLAHRFSTEKTQWLLPKGRSAREELESARSAWHGAFHVKPSITDAEAAIIVATGVSPRKKAR